MGNSAGIKWLSESQDDKIADLSRRERPKQGSSPETRIGDCRGVNGLEASLSPPNLPRLRTLQFYLSPYRPSSTQ
jgi:hypothetical protein